MSDDIRILLLADSHLGFDLPVHARVERRRRGHDFVANYATALEPALRGEVDLVVHAGDVFDRPSIVPSIAYQAYEPLRRVAERGVPVFIVPGNHERSRLPHARLVAHPLVHVFDGPRTHTVAVRNTRIALSGFPYERRDVRTECSALVDQTEWKQAVADVRLLCIHHCVEGASVGPADFTFRTASDVVRAREVPPAFSAVLSGHIHRHQVLTTGLDGRALRTPILYPGSIERTSFAEISEPKGFMVLTVAESERDTEVRWEFRQLPARPMVRAELAVDTMDVPALDSAIQGVVGRAPIDAVLSIRVAGAITEAHWRVLSSRHLREFVPKTMNLEITPAERFDARRGQSTRTRPIEETIQHAFF